MEIFESFQALFEQANPFFLAILLLVVGFLWFLPAILAFFFNRKHLKLIAAACIPAGFSIIAWCGLIIWLSQVEVSKNSLRPRKSQPRHKTVNLLYLANGVLLL